RLLEPTGLGGAAPQEHRRQHRGLGTGTGSSQDLRRDPLVVPAGQPHTLESVDQAQMMAGIFAALGDPTRTTLISRLVAEGRGTATSLTAVTDVSRQAVDRHLRVLSDAGLVVSHREGREVVYAL